MQMKTTRCHTTYQNGQNKSDNTKCWQDSEKLGHTCCWWRCTIMQPLWKFVNFKNQNVQNHII